MQAHVHLSCCSVEVSEHMCSYGIYIVLTSVYLWLTLAMLHCRCLLTNVQCCATDLLFKVLQFQVDHLVSGTDSDSVPVLGMHVRCKKRRHA